MKTKFPIAVTHKGVTAKIHQAIQIQGGKPYEGYMVIYWLLGKRKRVWRSKLDDAKKAAEDACERIANGDQQILELKNEDRKTYLRALEPLVAIGVELDVATHSYAAAIKALPPGVTLNDAVISFRKRTDTVIEIRTVQQVTDDMLAAKRLAKLSDVHIKDLECRLSRFADDFQMNIGDVTGRMIQAWLDGLKAKGRTKQNYFRHIASLIRFAVKRKYLPKEAIDEVKAVETPKKDATEIEIFTPDELGKLFSACRTSVKERGKWRTREDMVPYLAIAAFCGLRAAEIQRLDWAEIHMDGHEKFVEVKASKAKTGSRRIVPIPDNCAAWLATCAKKNGPVATFDRCDKQLFIYLANQATVPWKHNGLRHSFCSYRLAVIKNTAQVALEAGNSPSMIFQHYRQLVTETEAAKWFSIVPSNN